MAKHTHEVFDSSAAERENELARRQDLLLKYGGEPSKVAELLDDWYGIKLELACEPTQPSVDVRVETTIHLDSEKVHADLYRRLVEEYNNQKLEAFSDTSLPAVDVSGASVWRPEPWNVPRGMYLWDWFPNSYTCPSRERLGRVGDGGKWTCGVELMKQTEDCIVYSYGVRDDVTFELELIARTGCRVHAFDPSIGSISVPADLVKSGHFTWHKQALAGRSGAVGGFANAETLHDTMNRLGHSRLTLLKVDIEGSEWDVFSHLFSTPDSPTHR
jgi:hypothetical protein